ncbi:MAG: hypothetical protein ACFFD4_06255 [Candidatus Odinarchaeota archaeon]
MLIAESLILVAIIVTMSTAGIVYTWLAKNSPLYEMKLMSLGLWVLTLTYVCYLVTPLNSMPNSLNESFIFMDRIGYILGVLGIMIVAYSFLLVDFKPAYQSLFFFCFITGYGMMTAIYNSLNMEVTVIGEYIEASYPATGMVMIAVFYVFILAILVSRVRNVIRILGRDNIRTVRTLKTSIGFFAIIFFIIVIYLLTEFFASTPGNLAHIFIPLLPIYALVVTWKDQGFFFITPTKLDAIIIMNKESGLTLYSRSFEKDLPPEALISSMFSALNISLQETVQSDSTLDEIRFGDKYVLMDHGKLVTSLLIVSDNNFVTAAVSKYLTKSFEKQYGEKIASTGKKPLKSGDYKSFGDTISFVRLFIPL